MTTPKMSYLASVIRSPLKEVFHPCAARLAFAAGALLLSGCAGFGGSPPTAGESESAVVTKLGRPTHVFQDGDTRILEFMYGPFGQTTYFARIAGDGRLISYEQVLTTQKFSQIAIGRATKTDVLRLIGTPSETSYLDLPQLEVWSYPYLENPVSNSVMHVHFDRSGVVQKILNAPDLRRDSDLGAMNMGTGVLGRMR